MYRVPVILVDVVLKSKIAPVLNEFLTILVIKKCNLNRHLSGVLIGSGSLQLML